MALASVGKGDSAAHLRPTSDRVRESIFNLLAHGNYGDPISDAVVLDLFAGTGALGLEALSRGARHVTFVESGRIAGRILAANIAKAKGEGVTRVVGLDATRLAANSADAATLAFLDPPYGKDLGASALKSALAGGWIADQAVVVWEEASPQQVPEGFVLLDRRRYGETHLTIIGRLSGVIS